MGVQPSIASDFAMFPWNLAKSAEEMFSRWALKRLCKFLLKKKLGQFLLGDIDLDQLDVQLIEGTIQLSDLALNAEFLNQKLSAASVIIKEGSIGSLSVKMPWKGKGFEVEVDELEIVLAPLRMENTLTIQEESFGSAEKNHQHQELGSRHDAIESSVKPTSVHEGVKTIAKLVKWILTSFQVTIKKLIIAFDPFSEEDKKMTGCKSTLVFRISEIECGTCVSDRGNSDTNPKIESFLGMNELTNFVKFHGAVLELLQTENVDNQMNLGNATQRTLGGLSSVSSPSHVTIPILSGRIGGFSGNLKFSVPWKDGSFDICKVDANVFIDHVYLKLQLSTIKQFLILWEAYTNLNKGGSSYHDKLVDSAAITSGNNFPSCGGFPSDFSSSTLHESLNEGLLHHSHLIADWLPFSVKDSREENIVVGELDFGASVDQFFECLDEMRSSQSAFGNSGMWNWKNSVFSAITAASSLASGSLHIPSDQKHVETNLKANFAGLSITLSFHDDDQTMLLDQRIDGSSEQHFVAAECRDIILVTQVSLQEMRFHGTVEYVEVFDYISYKENGTDFSFLIQHLQANVQDALPPLPVSFNDNDMDLVNDSAFSNFLLGNSVDATKVTLLETFGTTSCQVNVTSSSQDENSKSSNSFSLKLSPFVLWVNFPLISTFLDFLKKIEKYVVLNEEKNVFSFKAFQKNNGTCEKDVERNSVHVKTITAKRFLGDIFISNARVILCFPFESGQSIRNYSSWEQFIALDFSSPPDLDKGVSPECDLSPDSSLRKQYLTAAKALHFNVGNLGVFLITPIVDGAKVYFDKMLTQKFLAHSILSIMNNRSCSPVVTMFWQEGHVTGPWIAKKARSLAREESRCRYKFVGKGHEFTSASAVKDMKESYYQTRQEMILSSTLVLHFSLHLVKIHLNSFQYKGVSCLLNQLMKEFSNVACDAADTVKQVSPSQRSIVVDCDCVEISMNPDTKDNIKSSIQKELPGSWYHLKLEVQKFELMSVSDVGGIKDASFFWLAHGEGKLSGFITGVPDHAFLLISCSNTTLKRGNGEGSNVLSSRLAGSNIIHMLDSESGHSYTTINLRCMTFVAVGGRLDWLDTISSFFAPTEQVTEKTVQRENKKESSGVTFFLILVDVGLSYEPYSNNLLVSSELHGLKSSCSISNQGLGEKYVACLLAASSLTLSNSTMDDAVKDDYRIALQDVGLLIKGLSKPECLGGTYSVEHLAKIGYVKVAREALIEATMKTNCSSGLLWEVEFSKCHIFMETCPDTTSGMIRLAAQLQLLYAPELEESVLHLQARWNNVQQAQESELFDNEASSPHSSVDKETDGCLVGLMNEICEDAFLSGKNRSLKYNSAEVTVCNPPDESIPMEISFQSHETLNSYCPDNPFTATELKRSEASFTPECSYPEFIEEYCLSELRSLSELSLCRPMLHDSSKSRNEDLGEEINGWYGDMSLTIVENHIDESCISEQSVEEDLSCESRKIFNFGKAAGCVLFTNIDIIWRMYGGSDWNGNRENGKQIIKFCKRDVNACLELALSGIQVQYDVFLDGGLCTSRLSLSVQDLHLYDKSKDAPWKLMIGYYNSKDHPRESSSKAFKMELEAIRPDPSTPLEEYRLLVSFLPILFHLHQQQLDFLINFFGNSSTSMDQSSSHLQSSDNLKSLPIACRSLAGHTVVEEALLPYFQKFDVRPSVVRVDYSPNHVDLAALRGGKYVELVNLVPWKGVELQLKHVHAVGIYGWSNVCETVVGEWLEDISHNQIHKILGGLPTIRSLVAVGAGASKLVSLPVESYRKDRRILKGMQRGTIAFLRSISLEAVALGVHLAAGAHDILVQAEYIVTSSPSVNVRSKAKVNARSNQPKDAQEGIQKAYESLSDGLGKSTSALVRTPLKKYQRGAGAGSALVTAVRALPTAAIAPASACASALHYAFLGFRNSLDPDRKKESMEKYMGPTESWEH